MNRKSRMKSTLDSLFSSNKNQPQEPEAPASPAPVEKPAEKAVEKPAKAPEKKSALKKAETPKPAAQKSAKATPAAPVEKAPEPTAATAPAPAPQAEVKAVEPAPTPTPAPAPVPAAKKEEKPVEMPAAPAPAQPVEAKPKMVDTPAPAPEAVSGNGGHTVEDTDEEVHLVVFLLAGEAFGIAIQTVESIIKKQAITKVPHAQKFILGVTNLRGTVVPVVDLRQRFNMPQAEATKDTRIIVLNSESGKNGIVVDEVMEVLRIPKSAIAPTPMIATTVNSSFIKGIARTDERLIILLDVNTVLAS